MRARQFLLPLVPVPFVSIPVTSRAVSPGGAEWMEQGKLTGSDAASEKWFGNSAAISGHTAISGNTAIVGVYFNGDQDSYSGSAYLFDVTTGGQLHKLTASDATKGDTFGKSVAISGNMAIVGARGADDAGSNSGSAYLFDVTTGNQLQKLVASDAATDDFFGESVAISGNTAIIGAPIDDYTGVKPGSAYIFAVPEPSTLIRVTMGAFGLLAYARRRRK